MELRFVKGTITNLFGFLLFKKEVLTTCFSTINLVDPFDESVLYMQFASNSYTFIELNITVKVATSNHCLMLSATYFDHISDI